MSTLLVPWPVLSPHRPIPNINNVLIELDLLIKVLKAVRLEKAEKQEVIATSRYAPCDVFL